MNYDDNNNNNDFKSANNKNISQNGQRQKPDHKVLMMDGTHMKHIILNNHNDHQLKLKLQPIWTSTVWPWQQANFQPSFSKNIDDNDDDEDEQSAGVVKLVGSFLIGILFLSLVAIAVFIRVETNKSTTTTRTTTMMDMAASSSPTTMTSNRINSMIITNNNNRSKEKNNSGNTNNNNDNHHQNGAIILASLLSSSPSRLSSSSINENVEPNPTLRMVNNLLLSDSSNASNNTNNKINNSKKREIQQPQTISERQEINDSNLIPYSEAKSLPSSISSTTISSIIINGSNLMLSNQMNRSITEQLPKHQRIIIEMDIIKVTKPMISNDDDDGGGGGIDDDVDNVNDNSSSSS